MQNLLFMLGGGLKISLNNTDQLRVHMYNYWHNELAACIMNIIIFVICKNIEDVTVFCRRIHYDKCCEYFLFRFPVNIGILCYHCQGKR